MYFLFLCFIVCVIFFVKKDVFWKSFRVCFLMWNLFFFSFIDMIIINDLKWNVYRCSYVFFLFFLYEMNLFLEYYKWGGVRSDERWYYGILFYGGGFRCGYWYNYFRLFYMEFYRFYGSESFNISKYYCCLYVE